MAIIDLIRSLAPRALKNILKRGRDCLTWDPWASRSWSQEGEDMVLRRLFESPHTGFYVDVGAHHPKRFSNTFLFYRRGWSGINIDAMPGSMRLFNRWRPRDINLEVGVAQISGSIDYYMFNEPALNGFSAELSNERNDANNPYEIRKIIIVKVFPLKEILEKYLSGREIDFLSVDVEGLDLDVLKSNDWSKFRPMFVLVEVLKSSLHELENDPVVQFMKGRGYVFYAKQVNTVFFKDALGDPALIDRNN